MVPPGEQGRNGFDLSGDSGIPTKPKSQSGGAVRRHFAAVGRDASGTVTVTIELVGGGGALVEVTGTDAAALSDAAHGKLDYFFDPAILSLANDRSGGSELKSPSWGYGTFAFGGKGRTGYLPLNDQELNSGNSFEDGEESAFIIGGSLTAPLAGPQEAKAWAWAGYTLLSMPAASAADVQSYGSQSQAFGDLLDWGFNYGYFAVLEAESGAVLSDAAVHGLIDNYRCHGRFGGLVLGSNHSDNTAVAQAARTMRTSARGPWLLP